MSRKLGVPSGTYRVTDSTVIVVDDTGAVVQQMSREAWEQTAQDSGQSYDDLLKLPEQLSPDDPRLVNARWRKSNFEKGEDGVEVALLGDDLIVVRPAGDPAAPVLAFTRDEWDAFVAGILAGEFDE